MIYSKCTFLVLGASCLMFNISCSEDKATDPVVMEPTLPTPTSVVVKDVGNVGNATDLELSFSSSNSELIEEYRIFAVKTANVGAFDSIVSLQIVSDNYAILKAGVSSSKVKFDEDFTDVDGDIVIEEVEYNFFVLAKGTADSELGGKLSSPSNTVDLEQKKVVTTLTAKIAGGSGGMDVDAEGNIYMGDFGTSLSGAPGRLVYKITPDGTVSTFATGLVGASGNDFDNEGNLYQSNIQGGSISKITPDGNVTTFATGLNGPVGIAFDGTSDFYVCNCSNNTISKVSASGAVSLFSSSTLFNCPNGIDIDRNGNLYVANFSNSTIVKVSPDGSASALTTMPGTNMGHLLINGSALYIVARGLNSIYKIGLAGGSPELFAGTGVRGLDDGELDEATFSLPNDIAFSPDGSKIYINDVAVTSGNPSLISPVVIREIDLLK